MGMSTGNLHKECSYSCRAERETEKVRYIQLVVGLQLFVVFVTLFTAAGDSSERVKAS